MRNLVAVSGLACGLACGAALLSGAMAPAWALADSAAEPGAGLSTFNIGVARSVLQLPASKEPGAPGTPANGQDSGQELGDEDFGDYLEGGPATGEDDPLESINRPIFDFNLTLDRWVLRPITRIYIETVPAPGRTGIANVLDNVKSPVVFANDLLQGEMSRAGATLGRFFINTVFGLGGLFDTADALGLPGHDEDFGQTLATYGVGGSPYIVLPFFGPSNPRDAAGDAVDLVFDPLTFVTPTNLSPVKTGVGVVSDRAGVLSETEALEATSIDFYAAVRSFYYQNRDFEIRNGKESERPRPGGSAPKGASAPEATPASAVGLDPYGDLEEETAAP